MLKLAKIDQLAGKVAAEALKGGGFRSVSTEPAIDSDGHDALQVTIILSDEKIDQISGDNALAAIAGIQRILLAKGEERFPIIKFATESEIEAGVDTES